MRIATVADVHVGNFPRNGGRHIAGVNDRCRATLAVLAEAAKIAKDADAVLVIAGDLFDKARPSPQVIRATMDALGDVEWRAIPGNHDRVTDLLGDHALAPLGAMSNGTVYDAPTVADGILFIPPAPRGESAAIYLDAALGAHPGAVHTVIAHFGLPEGHEHPAMRPPATLSVDDAARILKKHKVARILSGDWHGHKIWDRGAHIEQIGALVPTGWNNPGMGYGKVAVWDLETGEVERSVVQGPRFVETNDPEVAKKYLGFSDVYVKLTASKEVAALVDEDPNLWVEPKVEDIDRDVDVQQATRDGRAEALRQAANELVPVEFREEALALAQSALAAWGKDV